MGGVQVSYLQIYHGVLLQQDCDFLREMEESVQHSPEVSIFTHREVCPDDARAQSLQNKLGGNTSVDRNEW